MSVAVAVTHVAAALLIVSGATKLVRPGSTVAALAAIGLPHGRRTVAAVVGVGEVAVAVAVLAAGGPISTSLLAAVYAAFAATVVRLRRRDAAAPCGCFGNTAPPGAGHVVVNAVLAAAAVVASTDMPSLGSVVSDQPLAGVPYLVLAVTATYCLYAVLAVLPEVRAAARRDRPAVAEFSRR